MSIQMYDPKRDYANHQKEYDEAIRNVLQSGKFINGPEIKELENVLAEYVGTKHCIGISSGTDALLVALMALNIGSNDEVITVSHTWISTAEVIAVLKAKPIFVDIEDCTFNIAIDKIEEKITDRTKAIMPVNLYGQMPDYDAINKLAEKYNLYVIEDAAQSFGALQNNKKSCSFGTIGCTSFFPSKPLGCFGDGGACFTDDDDLANKMRAIRNHGGKRFQHEYIGLNARLDTIQASVLLAKFKNFDKSLLCRNAVANYYTEQLKDIKELRLPIVQDGNTHVWAQYSIIVETRRDEIVAHMKENGINVAIFYPKPLHTQKCFQYLDNNDDLSVTEKVCETVFNLPCYAELTKVEQDTIIDTLKNMFV